MARIRKWSENQDALLIEFHCPGCNMSHVVSSKIHNFNGNYDLPTLSPSIGWTYLSKDGFDCHSYVKDGMIQFLSDCKHKLAGQTVPLPEFE